ncbi:hypothetical protein KC19_5G170800 [Ceratodon purpureus]|uniref:Pectate lyase n=1 Tax=Ceratodon purpureus TaxID=3225 RepID=A0A8T0I2I9_CERPU|nr:hypothetical protein KC19_5G170800 [Ceratodon purpureus]KAG0577662.1 hypothetical protein KC19_5G170800 [Ceratodon purpureus]
MENYASACYLLRFLVLLVCVLQLSHVHCEGEGAVTTLNGNTGANDQGQRYVDGFANLLGKEARTITSLKVLLQSFFNVQDKTGAPEEEIEDRQSRDSENQDKFVEKEKFFITSGARFVHSQENQEVEVNFDAGVGEPFLLMPFEKDTPLPCLTGNHIDDCWRCDTDWQDHRQRLATCAIGFGSNAMGGKNGELYVVTTDQDNKKFPAPGTLRYGVTRTEPLWIIFAYSMTIQLKGELLVSSYKTIDGRGANVHLIGSSQISIENVSNVIIHGIHIHDIVKSGPHHILSGPSRYTLRSKAPGDAIHIEGSRDVWIDHCFLAKATDGLIDATMNSTSITVSNCYFENHDKVMLFGADADHEFDRDMQITVAFNRFGPGLTQRMPRCRYGNCHVANNYYTDGWGKYAIGGSCDPTILSQGNIFVAAKAKKEVTNRIIEVSCNGYGDWKEWHWTSSGDIFENDAYFVPSGEQDVSSNAYQNARSFNVRSAPLVPAMTKDAGPLNCTPKTPCKQ